MSCTFPKQERLKSRKQIEMLFDNGQLITRFPLRLIYLRTSGEDAPQFRTGVTVSSRVFRHATDRNRIKRLLREAYRRNKPSTFNNIEGKFAFLFLYLGKELPVYREIEHKMKAVLAKFITEQHDEKNS